MSVNPHSPIRNPQFSRREFVVAAGAAAVAAPAIAGEPRSYRACVIGHTGRGDYGHGLDLAFQKVPGVQVVAVADPDARGRSEAARRAGASRSYGDFREMLEKERPDLVTIGPRWVENRLEMVTAAAEVGAHVYMEKPMAASPAEADAIIERAGKRGIKIAIAHQVRVAPAILHLKRLLDEGLIGGLLEMRARGKEDHRAGGEDLMVLGTHCLYLMRLFAGEAAWCSARVTQDGREVTAADRRAATEPLGPVAGDSIQASYAFPGGVEGHFASQKVGPGLGGRFQIALYGSKGIVVVHIDQDPQIYFLPDKLWSPGKTGSRWQPLPGAPSNEDPTGLSGAQAANRRIVLDLIRAIETGGESVAGAHEGRATLEMIFAVYASHLAGARAALPLKDRRHPLAPAG
jgi:predicted dehydrogenase